MAAAALLRNPRCRLIIPRFPFASLFSFAKTPPPPPPAASGGSSTKELKTAILAESDPDRLVAAFESIAHSSRFHFHHDLYSLAIRKLTRADRSDLIERLLDHSATHPHSPHRDDFTARIINLYSSARMLDSAIRTFDAALASNRPIADRSLYALFSAFLKAGQYDRAISTFDHLTTQLGLTPGLYPHNILLKIMCKKGDLAAARQLLDEMADKNTADIASYTILLDGYLWQGDEAAAAGVLAEMEGKGLVPDAITYSCRIAGLCRKEEVEEAEKMLDEMSVNGVAPNSPTFKLIILGYDKVSDVDSALRVYNRMMYLKREEGRKDLAVDTETLTILMEGLVKKGDFDAALEVCKECLSRRTTPPFELVKGLAETLKGKLKVDEARDIVKKMSAVLKGDDLDAWKKVESELCLPLSAKDRWRSRRFPYAPPVLKMRNR